LAAKGWRKGERLRASRAHAVTLAATARHQTESKHADSCSITVVACSLLQLHVVLATGAVAVIAVFQLVLLLLLLLQKQQLNCDEGVAFRKPHTYHCLYVNLEADDGSIVVGVWHSGGHTHTIACMVT